jgi:hypothetical protein
MSKARHYRRRFRRAAGQFPGNRSGPRLQKDCSRHCHGGRRGVYASVPGSKSQGLHLLPMPSEPLVLRPNILAGAGRCEFDKLGQTTPAARHHRVEEKGETKLKAWLAICDLREGRITAVPEFPALIHPVRGVIGGYKLEFLAECGPKCVLIFLQSLRRAAEELGTVRPVKNLFRLKEIVRAGSA